jgi:uncharacterized membrane protein YagU involved in acid resistance
VTAQRAVLVGGLTAGALDILDPIVFYWFRGVTPIQILQSVATGLLGREAYSGGWATAVLGLVCHVLIALTAATVYVVVSRRLSVLRRRPWICGPLFGLAVFAVMRLVVLPLSAASPGALGGWALVNQLFAHTVLVGLPIALATSRVEP